MTSATPDIIVVRGAPGSGKSQAAKALAARIGRGARIEVDTLRAMAFPVHWTDQEEHIGVLSIAADVAFGFLRLGRRPVIVVDTFSGDKIVGFLSKLQAGKPELDARVFALVAAPAVLKTRIEKRPAPHFKDLAICLRQNADVIEHHKPFERLIDNSALTPEDTAARILAELCLR